MTILKKQTVVSDKDREEGHRAHFLGYQSGLKAPFNSTQLVQLASQITLPNDDVPYFQALLESLNRKNDFPYSWTPQEQFFIDNNPPNKIIPYLIYRYKFRTLPLLRTITKTPVHIAIEPASKCNLRCPMCFQVDKTFTDGHPMGLMRMELFKKIIDQAAEGGTGAISIGSRGEPFLNRNLSEMIKYASDKGAFYDLKINTNATVLPERACHALLSSKMNVITLSIDAHEKELYESIRVNAKFEKVLANVKRLNKIRKEYYPSSRAEIRISGVHISEKQDEKAFRKFWNNYCDTIVYVSAQERWDTYGNTLHPENNVPCLFLWERLLICFDGTCNPCDEDYKTLLSPGNINKTSLQEIWQGPSMSKIRSDHLNNMRHCHNPCDRCGV